SRGCPGSLPGRRGTVPPRRLGGGGELVQPRPHLATRPLLVPVLPRRLSPQVAAVGSGPGRADRLPGPATRLRVGVPLPELHQRTAPGTARRRGRFPQRPATRPERGRPLRPVPHPRGPPLPTGGTGPRRGRLPLGRGPEA